MVKIVVLDYGLGNVRSVGNALRSVGASPEVSSDLGLIGRSDALVIPGVGAFPQGMANLRGAGLIEVIERYITSGRPVLGICLGMQLLFDSGTEFTVTQGLSVIPGVVDRIALASAHGRLPHIAWSTTQPSSLGARTVFAGLAPHEQRFYFVHSYAASGVPGEHLSATVRYLDQDIVAAVQRGTVWGTQFHPEKSGPSGLHVLKNFVAQCS